MYIYINSEEVVMRSKQTEKKENYSYIRQMRNTLGMTLNKLGEACGVATSTIAQLEQREATGNITIENLKRAAAAMNCDFEYRFVPKTEVSEFVNRKAYEKAKRIVQSVDLHMSLENQKVKGDMEDKIQRLKKKLINEGKVW